jgi:DNA invertase Pin-like site-specific DNA recombinase
MQHYQFTNLDHSLVTAEHLKRTAIVYVRQSTEGNAGSRALCESQVELARAYTWPEHLIAVIDEDVGKGGFSVNDRRGWQHMLAEIATNSVGIVFATSVSRLSRQPSAYEQLLSLAADHGMLLCIGNRIIDPSDRLWRGDQ